MGQRKMPARRNSLDTRRASRQLRQHRRWGRCLRQCPLSHSVTGVCTRCRRFCCCCCSCCSCGRRSRPPLTTTTPTPGERARRPSCGAPASDVFCRLPAPNELHVWHMAPKGRCIGRQHPRQARKKRHGAKFTPRSPWRPAHTAVQERASHGANLSWHTACPVIQHKIHPNRRH